MKDLYRNPFEGINAGKLTDEDILEYWCSPFSYKLFSEIKESDIYSDQNNIVFMGGRSTGKTMFLRYWSYQVQMKKAIKESTAAQDLAKYFVEQKGVGFYLRIDGPVLRSFEGFDVSESTWASVFSHYFELVVGRSYIEFLDELVRLNALTKDSLTSFLSELGSLFDYSDWTDLEQALQHLDKCIRQVDEYRGQVPFYSDSFKPAKGFASQTLSFGIPKLIVKHIPEFKAGLNFIILIDEYENFLSLQQQMINTLLRFSTSKINFRIGMRLEGFRTYEMISNDDFIKEGREYRKIVFDDVLQKDKNYRKFLIEISRKRLEKVEIFKSKGLIDINMFLGDSEDMEAEASKLVAKNPSLHFKYFKDDLEKYTTEQIQLIEYPGNPLLELLNIIWIRRGVALIDVHKAMNGYLSKKKDDLSKKYKMDYVDKYKLSLMILLSSIHRRNKNYYSFNTFSFLSSGIVGHFMELCRRAFAYAAFENKDLLIDSGQISIEQQSKAAREVSDAELQQLQRIETHGGRIYKFINNLGNVFRDFHKDDKIKYPETNQFAFDFGSLEDAKYKNAFRDAIKWSAIQRKTALQQPAPGKHLKDLYTLNRIFSPSFQISYRTRGGYSIPLTAEDIIYLMTEQEAKTNRYLKPDRTKKKKDDDSQNLTLF
jgi:hypothetical protein